MSTLAPAKVMSLKEQPQQPSIPSIKLPFPAKQTEYKKKLIYNLSNCCEHSFIGDAE